jgi:hypothetical protein
MTDVRIVEMGRTKDSKSLLSAMVPETELS